MMMWIRKLLSPASLAVAASLAALVLFNVLYEPAQTQKRQFIATSAHNPKKLEPIKENQTRPALPAIYIEQEAQVAPKQTLSSVLKRAGLNAKDIHLATKALNKVYNLSRMPANTTFMFSYLESENNTTPALAELALYTKDDKAIKITRTTSGTYKAKVDQRTTLRTPKVAIGTISSSLYLAAQRAGLPDRLIVPFIELFSWDLDFTRDIRKGDTFRIVYEEIRNERGEFIRYGNILAGEMDLKRLKKTVSAFRAPNNAFYNEQGRAKKKALLRTPIKFSRISSHFNPNRKHPVLGYTRAHRGTDFAASTGTPVRASGDGRIEKLGWRGGYGRYIRIRHGSKFSTAYAHLSRYKKGMRQGRWVKQGDIIGYVGMSGTATGPHLHYEVLQNGRQVNAMRVKLPAGAPLAQKERSTFNQRVALAQKMWQQETQLAQSGK